jgi:hypothetical protein
MSIKPNQDPQWLKRMSELEDGCDIGVGGSTFVSTPRHFVSASCGGETCSICHRPATHKVSEEIMDDDERPIRHPLAAYLCCRCFRLVVGPAAKCGE